MNALNKTLANALKTGGLAQQTIRLPRTLKGKAVLVVDALNDEHGNRTYETDSRLKSCVGDHPEDAYLELHHFGTAERVVPNQCKRMGIGDRWHIDVVYKLTYTPTVDGEGNEDWDVRLVFLKAKTLNKSPWSDKRHKRYVSKSKR